MNFDDLKKAWQEQETPGVLIDPKNVDKKDSRLPLEKIRKNVKFEIWIQVLGIFLVAFAPSLLPVLQDKIGEFYLFYALFVIITFYYIVKMFLFYRLSAQLELNSKDSVYESYYNIRLYVQMYEGFCYSLIPFGILLLLAVSSSNRLEGGLSGNVEDLLQLFVISTIMLVSIYVLTKFWVKSMYGQYLKQIAGTLEHFKECN